MGVEADRCEVVAYPPRSLLRAVISPPPEHNNLACTFMRRNIPCSECYARTKCVAVALSAGQVGGCRRSVRSAQARAAGLRPRTAAVGGIEGDGVTAPGLDLRSGRPAHEIAVDPSMIPLGRWVYVRPNPFGTARPF